MRVNRRQLMVSAAVVVGLLVPTAPLATAAGDGGPGARKQALLDQMTDRSRTQSTRPGSASGGPIGRLAAARGTGKVVLAIKVRPGANGAASALAAVAGSGRTQGGKQRHSLPELGTVTFEVPEAAVEVFTTKMRGRSDVARVEPAHRRSLSFIPNDEMYPTTASYLGAVTAPAAWDVWPGDPNVHIAVVDSGVDVNHPDLEGRVAGTYNAVDGTADVTDAMGHGTFVAGVAAATGGNTIGIAGASMGASVLGVKVANDFGEIWTDDVANGITWAANNGAKVINLSLGSPEDDPTEREAVAYAISKGVLVVAAAGNAGGTQTATTPNYPAAYPSVVAVGATNATGGRAPFSSYGPWVTVAAPGVSITSTTPTSGTTDFAPSYDVGHGTSFSSPIVAAEAALLWSLRPTVSASDVRAAIVRSAHGYATLGLGAGQVDFRAAYDALRPVTVPALTSPVSGAIVAGLVPLSATSTAPKVSFRINGVPVGAPVATVAGATSTTWTSWGQVNEVKIVTAADCSLRDLCNTEAAEVGVTLTNAAPVVTSPKAGQALSGTATFTATAPGGGIAFLIDGVRRGFDATAPYALTYPISSLIDGTHAIEAVSCSTTGTSCAGPVSAPVTFTARALHPRFTAISPTVFSPNGDGRRDATKATYYLPDTEYVRLRIRNAAGTVIRGPITLGTLTAGTRAFTWNGLTSTGARAANGTYTLELATSRVTSTGTLIGSAVARVRVDRTAPTMSSITGSGTRFYPYPDGYRDNFTAKLTLSEPATVTTTVRTGAGTLVRRWAGSKPAGPASILWNGRNTAGARVAAGTYYWTLTAQDPAGNRRSSARYSVIVSAKRLVTKTATLTQRGSQYYTVGSSDPSCAGASKSASDFYPYGVWLLNDCDPSYGNEIAASFYRFTLPAAHSHTSLRVLTYGNSYYAPSTLGAGFTQWATGGVTIRTISAGSTNAWRTVANVSASGLVNASGQVETGLFVPNDYSTACDFDISHVRLVVTYKVLV